MTDPCRHVALDLRCQPRQVLSDLRISRAAREQPHAAIDVVANAARRNDSVGGARGHDTADGKSISLVDIGHCEGGFLHARKGCGVDQLFQGALLEEMLDHLPAGIEPCRHAHVIAETARDLPCAGRNLLEILKAYRAHVFFPSAAILNFEPYAASFRRAAKVRTRNPSSPLEGYGFRVRHFAVAPRNECPGL